jgi:acetylornithine deacetylase/succinyl-diaminopimelate desuccinylase-like protein
VKSERKIRGGDFQNRLPTPLIVTGTRRWTPGQTGADVRAELQGVCDRLAAESGLAFTLSLEGPREPFETPARRWSSVGWSSKPCAVSSGK